MEPSAVKTEDGNTDDSVNTANQVLQTKTDSKEEEYNPFQLHITDELDRIYLRLYDAKYMHFVKVAEHRAAFQLALRYFRDANPTLGSIFDGLTDKEIVLLKGEKDDLDPIQLLFVSNLIPHTSVDCTHLSRFRLSPRQILMISTDCPNIEEEGLRRLVDFVTYGGTILSFNKAISVLDLAFPQMVTYRHGETTLDKKITLEVPESDDQQLFMGLINANERKKATRFCGSRRFAVVGDDSRVQVLVREVDPAPTPLAMKISISQGQIFHILPVGTDVCFFANVTDPT
eukprot:TRINITY_DN10293_c0_g3_i6.p1 TRINITY_DN10293_c0_g3~~TRINITY_DN10293_c0_g3_i6.p1  ORF type:complete len:287 (+),score=41.87 TRINITY_DN10293_c0_g3_i6:84-944(+)